MPTLNELICANLTRQVEWDTKSAIDISYRGNEMAGEMGEALEKALALIQLAIATGRASNVIKKLHREALGIVGSRATKEQLAAELGDVIICAALTAGHESIDLDEAVARSFNAKSDQFGFKTRLGPPVTSHENADAEVAEKKWIGVDLDGTLAAYDGWRSWREIGDPLWPMMHRVRHWVNVGNDVRIFTARVCFDIDVCRVTGEEFTRAQMVSAIQDWCQRWALPRLPVTNVKDIYMAELWDDRAVQMVPNTGRTLAEEHAAVVTADAGKAFGSGS
jgi:NTP pyrophosphatase (non-canonical NTP hydrolase)